MTDSEVKTLLPDYLESSLPAEQVRVVEAHLAVSSECREELDYLRRIQRLLAARPESAPPGLWHSIARRIGVEEAVEPWKQFEWVGKRFLPVLAAAVLLLAVLGNLSTEAPALTLEDYLNAQWDEQEAEMLTDAELSGGVLQILQSR
ncbi:MAG: zf-HC2 domain-containing protein [Candidatus Latescibacteria bacterium]|nr:zf-HC2 domain-containing protein [Candidatus Latescibacterota bacterium]